MASIDGCGIRIGGKVIILLILTTIVIILGVLLGALLGTLGKGLPGRIIGGSVGCGWFPGDGGCGPGIVPVPLDGVDGAGDGAGVPTGTAGPLLPPSHRWSCGNS